MKHVEGRLIIGMVWLVPKKESKKKGMIPDGHIEMGQNRPPLKACFSPYGNSSVLIIGVFSVYFLNAF